ncbi:DinB family protein [Streptomyces antimicrobicus]|uniref:DinB family protein n=1 Tax=Streptomyces antimicrobicus TaxID=2883108 RepID=A0ABS8BD95_9ACTN|nr:DinB family protein [Streptomyces antimicrobicus]MCB5182614.1 DinB family protein [Streptomyces antimicrobicus]
MASFTHHPVPPRLLPLLAQFDFATRRLLDRLAAGLRDSGNGSPVPETALTDAEYLWEPVPGCWSVRPRAAGPGPRATVLTGAGDFGRDATPAPHPVPPPFTTLAWRLSHLTELLTLRADHTAGSRSLTRDDVVVPGDAAGAVAAFTAAAAAWRAALVAADDAALDTVGHSAYPYGSDPQDPFLRTVWWVNQEVLHHGAEIALLRDLYRHRYRGPVESSSPS